MPAFVWILIIHAVIFLAFARGYDHLQRRHDAD